MSLKLPVFLPADGEASWLLIVLFRIWRHIATRKHLFLYSQCARSGLRKPKKDDHENQSQLLPVFVSLSQSQLIWQLILSFNQPNRKRYRARLVIVIKHLPHNVFLLWHHHYTRRMATKAKVAPSSHEVRLTPLDTNLVFQYLREKE